MNGDELRELGRLSGLIEGIGREIKVLREEGGRRDAAYMHAIADHDERDDQRFAGVGRELEYVKRQLALGEQRDTDEHSTEAASGQRWHNWQIAIFTGGCAIMAALATFALTLHYAGGHP